MKSILTVMSSLLLLNVSAQQYNALKIPAHTEQGKKTDIVYVPDSTTLSAARQISGRAYFYDRLKQLAMENFQLKHKGRSWKGSLNIPDSAVMMSLVFNAEDIKSTDNNQNKGYLFPIYKQGKAIQFAYARMADLLGAGPPDAAGIKKNHKQALVYMKEEMEVHPESEQALRSIFYNMLANSPDREDKVDLVKRLNSFKSDREEDLMMTQLYLSYFGGKKQADSLDQLLIRNFPDGNYVKSKRPQATKLAVKIEPDQLPKAIAGPTMSQAEILEKVRVNLINEPVNSISLKDLNGNSVAIGEGALKGKVIILDFWATWCKPCIASFPAMQKVIDHYRDHTSVQFLFIATMEQGDALKNVKQFMVKNNYSFKVLLDERTDDLNMYKAYANYKAEGGIPYKLVIDGDGRVRFRTSGFSGNEADLVAELSAMIDLALKSGK
ncbi:TlpA disulfide reductase family protein [Pedobacter sp. MC2016-24]|uniref:TlpA family protein disulfide reductase n=1 Tax=Pedobacter sp. MC2016-24 TaxID=2780090 RepID=UPI0018828EAD|nr:TlpA disulfide reductase family protein [Pedobacter sp. MC2016-24]MBE9601082.1 TlpA family protein disulfide reductase [Pedobacter sp. MC2016-24]